MDKGFTTSSLAVGVGIGVVIGWFLRGKLRRLSPVVSNNSRNTELDLTDSSPQLSDDGEYKMVIVVRNDLKMGKGKAAAQCAHGALGAAEKAMMKDSETLYAWKACGQPKVVVKTDSEQSLLQLAKEASANGLICSIIKDAGRTQIASGSKTVLAVGPGPANLIDKVTGHLKLY
ncbi:peptidyl-tRNA hydrolase 2, mitochondrial-like [Ruditapes philippinarum]|uniref:peptidyl-tRNA hydrolase 2, mitochondrial-like n=1 Tax=Ruditapes philippinarum TaxID=129788 RepID=UPI00295B2FC1|nr:peptidyl-tRNA hydrolase 2, mitochondrial-like [Ruditapes philippinarum]